MGVPENPLQMDGGVETDAKKWVIAGIQLRSPLKSIFTNAVDSKDEEECSTTPTADGMRIPSRLPCPPAPRKPKPSSRCHCNGIREFFKVPPDLETVFIRRIERA